MKGFLDIPYRLPFVKHYKRFDAGFYVDFPRQLRLMGEWLRESECRRTLDIGAMTGGCINYISRLGMRMDGVQFTPDIKRLATANLRKAGIRSTLFVSPVHAELRVPGRGVYDGAVSLGWFNLPFPRASLVRYFQRVHALLKPGGVFLFDFFEFKGLIIPPTESAKLGDGIELVSHAERRGDVLRRHYFWIRGQEVLYETGDLVARTKGEARKLLAASGFEVVKTRHLDFNYPREFWMVRKR